MQNWLILTCRYVSSKCVIKTFVYNLQDTDNYVIYSIYVLN